MKRIFTLSLIIISLLFSCEDKEEEPVKECTDPGFGESVGSMSGLEQGIGYITISNVWGSQMNDLTFEWEHGDTGPELYGLEPGIYTVTITNSEGCSATEEFDLRLDGSAPEGYSIGDTGPSGGKIFYVNEQGGGLEAAPISTIWSNIQWGCEGLEISTLQDLGAGQSNTNAIVSNCAESNTAAKLCSDLEINGYTDWYLPSSNELSRLGIAIYQEDLSGFPSGNYWSSTEVIYSMALREYLPDGGTDVLNKSTGANVIAIRSFGEGFDGTGGTDNPDGPGDTGGDGDTGGSVACTSSVTDVDGNTYDVVRIGDQCWMASNLRTRKYRNGDPILTDLDDTQWTNAKSGAYAKNYSADFASFLYNGYAVLDSRGICPQGWHLPTEDEIRTLLDLFGGRGVEAAEALKSKVGWCSTNPFSGNFLCENGSNSSGFNGQPGGARSEGGFRGKGNIGAWWSADGNLALGILGIVWEPEGPGIARTTHFGLDEGISCRCIQD